MNLRVLYFCAWLSLLTVVDAKVSCLYEDFASTYLVCSTTDDDNVLHREDIFKKMDVFQIIIKRCQISSIDIDAFYDVNFVSILDLSQNQIQSLKLGVFHSNIKLESLNLSYNLLTELPVGIFDRSAIKMLYLQGNRLKTLEPGLINIFPKIFRLDLSNNFLVGKNLSPDVLTDVTILNLSGNNMSEANFLNTINIIYLLDMDNCLLKYVPTFLANYQLNRLKRLKLSENEISSIENASTFNNLIELQILNMSHNYIAYIHSKVFTPLISLQKLDLSYNRLKTLSVDMFQNSGPLRDLNLSHNLLQEILPTSFEKTSLKRLSITDNKITYLDRNFLLQMAIGQVELTLIEFGGNPWQCACLREFFREMKDTEVAYDAKTFDGEHLSCVTEKEFICKRYKSVNDHFISMWNENV